MGSLVTYSVVHCNLHSVSNVQQSTMDGHLCTCSMANLTDITLSTAYYIVAYETKRAALGSWHAYGHLGVTLSQDVLVYISLGYQIKWHGVDLYDRIHIQ